MLRSLLGAARRYSFFSLSSLTLLSIYLFGNLLFVLPILLCLSLPSFVSPFLVSFFLYAVRASRLCPSPRSSFHPSPPSSSSSRARTRRAFRKRLSHVHAGVCAERTHMRGPLLRAVESKEGQQVDTYIRVSNNTGICIMCTYAHAYTCVYVPSVRRSFPCEIKTDRFIVIIVTHADPLICRVVNSPLMYDSARSNPACECV